MPYGDEHVLWAQRINGRDAINDHSRAPGSACAVERKLEGAAALHGLVGASIDDLFWRGERLPWFPT